MQQELTTQEPLVSSSSKDHCANCGNEMHGPYCARCGQATRHFIKFFPSVMREIVEDTFDIDGRFGRTIWTIMFRPGRATRDFLGGRRVHYTPPFRLYLFTSLLAFLLISIQVGDISRGLGADNADTEQAVIQPDTATETTPDDTEAPTDNPPDTTESPAGQEADTPGSSTNSLSVSAEDDEGFRIRLNGDQDWDPVDNPVDVGWLPDAVNGFLNRSIGNIQRNGPRIQEDPGLLIDKVIQLLPQTLFVLLPIFALILKFFYLFAKRYYMEHLIYSVHIHTFTLMVLILITALSMIENKLPDVLRTIVGIIELLLFIWIIIYSFIAQKRVYQQGWFLTFIKYNLVYITYSILQVTAIVIVIMIGAATL